MRTLIITLLLTSITAAPAIAQASDAAQDTIVRSVSVQDLDLDSAAGKRQLHQRIAAATEAVCGSYAATEQFEQDWIAQCRAGVAKKVDVQLARAKGLRNVELSAVERR
jgi:UrcA family protein